MRAASPTLPDLDALQRTAETADRPCVVGATILDEARRLFVPRRGPAVPVLPDIWDLVGGHVEDGESLLDALRREVGEETGWTVRGEPTLIYVGDWTYTNPAGAAVTRREFDFLVTVDGDLNRPVLSPDEHIGFRWITPDEIDLFDENGGADGGMLRRIAESAWHGRRSREPEVLLHVTAFLSPAELGVQELRRRWDPAGAAQIAAHVTIARPFELGDEARTMEEVAAAAVDTTPFALPAGRVVHDGDPADGIFLELLDPEGRWAALRRRLTGQATSTWPPHVTLVHPRTSGLGPLAWHDLRASDPLAAGSIEIGALAVTRFDGRAWQAVSHQPLTGSGSGQLTS